MNERYCWSEVLTACRVKVGCKLYEAYSRVHRPVQAPEASVFYHTRLKQICAYDVVCISN